MWAWGQLSPQTIQHLMALFKEDLALALIGGLSMTLITTLASLGAEGTIPGNVHRDLIRKLPASGMPTPHMFSVSHHASCCLRVSFAIVLNCLRCCLGTCAHAYFPIMVPLLHKVLGTTMKDTPMVLPHELISFIYHNYKDAFFTYIVPSTDILATFWRSVKGPSIVVAAIVLRVCLMAVHLAFVLQDTV